jgi:hypothetical protein
MAIDLDALAGKDGEVCTRSKSMGAARALSCLVSIVTVLASACAGVPMAQESAAYKEPKGEGTLSLHVGSSRLQDDEGFPIKDEDLTGASLRVINNNMSVGLELGYLEHEGEKSHESISGSGPFDYQTYASEVFVGLWAPIETRSFYQPHFGMGIDFLHVRVHESPPGVRGADRDDGTGAYALVGISFEVTRHIQAGVDLRGVAGNRLELFDVHANMNYTQLLFTVGYRF